VLGHHAVIDAAPSEDATVHLGVQGFHPTIHHLREAGVVGDFHGGDAVVLEEAKGAASGEDFDALGTEGAGEIHDAGLVGNTDQGAADEGELVGHGVLSIFGAVKSGCTA